VLDIDDMEADRNKTYSDRLYLGVTIHEIGHVFGFNRGMFDRFGYNTAVIDAGLTAQRQPQRIKILRVVVLSLWKTVFSVHTGTNHV
jgi:Leishmanolysin